MSEETPEVNDIKLEVDKPTVETPEVVPEVVATELDKPKRKTRKTTDEPVKPKTTRKKKVEVVAVGLEPQVAAPAPEPTPKPEPTPEPETLRVNNTDFFKVQQGMADLLPNMASITRETTANTQPMIKTSSCST